jgi:hypothetical protein
MIDKATPGPYKVTIGHRSAAYAIDAPQRKRAGGTNRICSVRPASRRPDAYDEAEANALLLASSWETAAALERVTAERNALVTALEKIAACSPERPHISAQAGFGHALGTLDKARGIARAALATKGYA